MKLNSTLLLILLSTGAILAAPLTLYVAPNGNDQWSGNIKEPAQSRKDGPLASLNEALTKARGLKSGESKTILLRNGTYQLAAPLVLTPSDSGTDAAYPLTIAAVPGEKPILSGGRRITGWKKVGTNLWETAIPSVREGKWYFRQLFVNGERRQRARTPNDGFFRIQGPSPTSSPVQIKFKPGEIKKEWADDGDVELVALVNWADLRMQIRAVDASNHVLTLSGDPRESNREDNAQFYIENAPDALDQAGEWYLDRKTGVLKYWPKAGEDMPSAEVIAPQLEELLLLKGDFAQKKSVRDVVLRGLTFSHTDWSLPTNGYADTQAAIRIQGDLLAEAAVDCTIEGCTFAHLGGYAIELGRGCQRVKIHGNEIADLAAGGVRIGETSGRTDPFDQNYGHTLTDNHIHHLGEVYAPAVGVLIMQSGTNRVAHNHIHDLYYTAISVGWTWGYRDSPCHANIIEFNHLHDIGKFRLSDMGAIYTLGPQPGTILRNNLIHDVNAFTYGGWGLYTDEGSSGIVLENNVVYRCKSAGFHQHYGRENIVRNNIFAFGKEHQLMRSREEAHISFILTNNIVYFDSGKLLGSYWSNDKYTIDGNIYYDSRPSAADAMKFAGSDLSAWHQRGHDSNSVIADPMFVAPQKADFRLQSNSPAFKLGFNPIDVSKIGVRDRRFATDNSGQR